jgi:hypothetical protein
VVEDGAEPPGPDVALFPRFKSSAKVSRWSTRVALIGAVTAVAVAMTPPSAPAAPPNVVPVVRCPTRYPFTQHPTPPHTITVLGRPASTRGLAAYTNAFTYLIGPVGMKCAGVQAVDGGSQVIIWPHRYAKPSLHSRSPGLTISIDPACASCKAYDACPLLPSVASSVGFPCTTAIPAGERVYVLRTTVVLFEDPPGVAGDGWPSGGPYPANGLVGEITSIPRYPGIYRSTCTLPASKHAVCTASLNDAIARYG